MIVFEKSTNRSSEVNIKEDNAVASVDEFDQYVASDSALCCFVGVDSGEEISITSNFRENTTRLQYDILIDDILRMSKVHNGTTVRAPHKVDNFSQFYAKQDSAMFEAILKTKPLQQDIELRKGSRETVGTIKVRISVLRRTGETHALTDANQWYEVQDWYEQYNRNGGYNPLPPSCEVELKEGLSVSFSKNRERARIRKSKTPHPGTAPWAVLRFFYRSKEAIARAELSLTYKHPLVKAVAHELQLEPVPEFPKSLSIGTESTSASEGKPSYISTLASDHTNEVMRNFTKHCSTASIPDSVTSSVIGLHDQVTTPPPTPKKKIPDAGLLMRSEPARNALHSIMKSALPAKSRMETMVISCTQVSPTTATENNVDIPTPTKQCNMRNPSQESINLKGSIENGDTNGRFIDNETVDRATSGNGTAQNGRARNHSVSEIIQNDATTANAHSRVLEKRPGTIALPGSASKRAKLMSPRESDQLKDKIAEAARKIQEAKPRP